MNNPCIICEKPTVLLYAKTRLGYGILHCKNCNFAQRNYIPPKNTMAQSYKKGYLEFLQTGLQGGEKKFRDYDARLLEKKQFLRLIQIPKQVPPSAQNIFDIGFGAGEFLEIFDKPGFQIDGCDLAPQSVDYVKSKFNKARLEYGFFEDLDLQANYYSVVIAWSLIEHFHNPNTVLKKAFEILKPGGILLMCGANFNSQKRKEMGTEWKLFSYNHFYFFSPLALKLALQKAGFKKVKFYHINNDGFFNKPRLLKRVFRRAMSFLHHGSLIQRSKKFYCLATKQT